MTALLETAEIAAACLVTLAAAAEIRPRGWCNTRLVEVGSAPYGSMRYYRAQGISMEGLENPFLLRDMLAGQAIRYS